MQVRWSQRDNKRKDERKSNMYTQNVMESNENETRTISTLADNPLVSLCQEQ